MNRYQKFVNLFIAYEDQMVFSFDREQYFNDVEDLRQYCMPRFELQQIPMLEYKNIIVKTLELDYPEAISNYSFTPAELLNNRVNTDKLAKGEENMKLTKFLAKKIKETGKCYKFEQRLDYFHKIGSSDESYFISGDPIDIVNLYRDIETCISPSGENASSMLQMLVSPFVYIAYSSNHLCRMLLYIDIERKLFATGSVYGKYNKMFELTVLKWFKENGYTMAKNAYDLFSTTHSYYVDNVNGGAITSAKAMNLSLLEKTENITRVDLFKKPVEIKNKNYDFITGEKATCEIDSTVINDIRTSGEYILTEDQAYCYECGGIVGSEHFDYDSDLCYDCSESVLYCDDCGETFYEEDFVLSADLCISCYEETEEFINQEEDSDYC